MQKKTSIKLENKILAIINFENTRHYCEFVEDIQFNKNIVNICGFTLAILENLNLRITFEKDMTDFFFNFSFSLNLEALDKLFLIAELH